MNEWLWLLLTAACIAWYSTITVYVAIKGVADIRTMIKHLGVARKSTKDSTEK